MAASGQSFDTSVFVTLPLYHVRQHFVAGLLVIF